LARLGIDGGMRLRQAASYRREQSVPSLAGGLLVNSPSHAAATLPSSPGRATIEEVRYRMNDHDQQDQIEQLMDQIRELPEAEREPLEDLARKTKDRHQRMRESVKELQESLDYLRLSVKYLIFDLEATRRENKYLRELLNRESADDQEL
jgi:ElaB/YqjD/DUF883 family membrane-anchored ribosome-binding protein